MFTGKEVSVCHMQEGQFGRTLLSKLIASNFLFTTLNERKNEKGFTKHPACTLFLHDLHNC